MRRLQTDVKVILRKEPGEYPYVVGVVLQEQIKHTTDDNVNRILLAENLSWDDVHVVSATLTEFDY